MPTPPKRKPARPATLADVGRAAGVSAMAVSAVLNGARTSSRTAPETRARILEAAERLQYRPNAAARALADRRMNTLGIAAVFEGNELNQYFLEVFNGVLAAAAEHGQNTTVFTLHDWTKDGERLPTFCDGRIDGLILLAPTMSKEAMGSLPEHTPHVAVHANQTPPKSVNLETDEEKGAFEMVSYLIGLGHRRILHLSGSRGLTGAERRIEGYHRALAAAKIRRDDNLLVETGFSIECGARAMKAWLKRSAGQPMPHAIFCANDGIAIGCLEALAAVGLRVPQDVSVVGFDDTLAARSTVPQLTTVRQPLRAMGSKAVEILLDRIQQSRTSALEKAPQSVVFPTELVIRSSAAKPPANEVIVPAAQA
jgi:LacI family transcriptional regulator